jgi:hypothetical protein
METNEQESIRKTKTAQRLSTLGRLLGHFSELI